MDNPLYKAFTGDDEEMMGYFEATTSDQMRFDFKALMNKTNELVLPVGMQSEPPQTSKLESFTMAAMQGFCANPSMVGKFGPTVTELETLSGAATLIAEATLSELSKQQQR